MLSLSVEKVGLALSEARRRSGPWRQSRYANVPSIPRLSFFLIFLFLSFCTHPWIISTKDECANGFFKRLKAIHARAGLIRVYSLLVDVYEEQATCRTVPDTAYRIMVRECAIGAFLYQQF